MNGVWRNYHECGTLNLVLYGEDPKHQYGMTVYGKKLCTPISSSRLHSDLGETIQHHIQVHAPTSDHEQFFELLDSIIAKTPRKDILVVQGD